MNGSDAPLGAYLRARRDALRPADTGIPDGSRRRVPGLRRQEVAALARISPEYYLRLEQGKDHQPSPQVLLALSRALQLDADAVDYLFRLAGQTVPARRLPEPVPAAEQSDQAMLDNVTTFMDQWTSAPAYVVDRNHDVLAVNSMGRSFIRLRLEPGTNMVEAVIHGAEQAEAARSDPEEMAFWDRAVRSHAASLRYYADTQDPRLQLLVASLSSRSRAFREAWASHEARPQRRGEALVQVDPFGLIPFRWQTLEVPGGGQYLTTFFGDPGSPAAAAIDYLRARERVDRAMRRAGVDPLTPDHLEEIDEPG